MNDAHPNLARSEATFPDAWPSFLESALSSKRISGLGGGGGGFRAIKEDLSIALELLEEEVVSDVIIGLGDRGGGGGGGRLATLRSDAELDGRKKWLPSTRSESLRLIDLERSLGDDGKRSCASLSAVEYETECREVELLCASCSNLLLRALTATACESSWESVDMIHVSTQESRIEDTLRDLYKSQKSSESWKKY